MQYRKFQADRMFNGFHWMEKGQVLILQPNGAIDDIVFASEAGEGIERLNGILLPGLINCHCHLELSHLKNAVPEHTGLIHFLISVIKKRGFPEGEIMEHMVAAEKEMTDNGIVAVADICNTSQGIGVKSKSSIYWHNLIELINLHDENLEKQLAHFNLVLSQHKNLDVKNTSSVLTPHAPYSVSAGSFRALNEATPGAVISIHNQETSAENELFKNGQGELLKLFATLGEQKSPFGISGTTSMQTWLPYFTNAQTILLVHNTFISEEDIVFAKSHSEKYRIKIVYCLCPNANLYIENSLPPVDLLLKHQCKIVLGTDSYSSNWQLNIAAEIKTLCDHFPHLSLETILKWVTANGAEVLNISSFAGSFEKGKKPGVVLLETEPLNKNMITGQSKRII